MTSFTVTKDHIKLLRRAHVSWDDCEYGAPCIDPKRPYGNSDVEDDIAEILEIELFEDAHGNKHLSKAESRFVERMHKETQMALQIFLSTGSMIPGDYVADKYGTNWKLREDK